MDKQMYRAVYRGKDKNGEWHYGYLCFNEQEDRYQIQTFIMLESRWETHVVDENTIGQFTGLTDKNEKWIYEGDKIKSKLWADNPFFVFWDTGGFLFKSMSNPKSPATPIDMIFDSTGCHFEVIGTIHD